MKYIKAFNDSINDMFQNTEERLLFINIKDNDKLEILNLMAEYRHYLFYYRNDNEYNKYLLSIRIDNTITDKIAYHKNIFAQRLKELSNIIGSLSYENIRLLFEMIRETDTFIIMYDLKDAALSYKFLSSDEHK